MINLGLCVVHCAMNSKSLISFNPHNIPNYEGPYWFSHIRELQTELREVSCDQIVSSVICAQVYLMQIVRFIN